ncbi:small GTP-binding protein [Basidiobolus meristosporus CBS 931.73]|uniref:Small GTP-binding protein n=1 Tax=Basidiobolus meristosporus CBS 931.73 TaxID=1314790 RepID=A0A1Y1Y145_9FUNG|nr:small GTP-binding protein [Basidiobolus meristosporus CBS 931.73]|eukprot:ORX91615.1 small GTP-binding protein [Basidiobolus meristosporus CBS 931.73]
MACRAPLKPSYGLFGLRTSVEAPVLNKSLGQATYRFLRAYSSAAADPENKEAAVNTLGTLIDSKFIRNIGIIAHVDHGKTTLVDSLLRQSGTLQNLSDVRVMDSNALEKERGITILSKVTSIMYKNHRINIVDTPGHADFGGEVERILSMVDGVALVVDATEGPMTQTKFVLSKALEAGLKPLVVINKVDRPTARTAEVDSELLDLFMTLGANDDQLEYPIVYASGKDGWAVENVGDEPQNMNPLFDLILDRVPSPNVDRSSPFSMLVTQIESNPYLGKCFLGKITSGTIKVNDRLHALDPEGNVTDEARVTKLFTRTGLEQIIVDEAGAGDIITIAGVKNATVNSTLCNPEVVTPLPSTPVDPPTVSMFFGVNDSPIAGQEGKYLTSTMIRDRLLKEAETNVALSVSQTAGQEGVEVCGRGELQLGILIETMRREGFELSISPPRVVLRKDPKTGATLEPVEEVTIDVDHEFTGTIIEKLAQRKAEMKIFTEAGDKARLIFHCPTRGLLGYHAEFKNDTRGLGVLNHIFHAWEPYKGEMEKTRKGALVSTAVGDSTSYALSLIEPRGKLFVLPGNKIYTGMVIGEYSKDTSDLEVNPVRAKAVNNMRAAGKDDAIKLSPIKPMSLEEIIAYVGNDEVVEVTPESIRLRKKELDPTKRKQRSKK